MELYKKYRPKKLKDIYGQDLVVKKIKAMTKKNDFPHTILFSGPSGCGKTTLAKIVAKRLKCHKTDYKEINAASERGVDDIRRIESRMHSMPLMGPVRVWTIDECHMLTREAKSASFKILEDTPDHIYFILCTTDPQKLDRPMITRSTKLDIHPVDEVDMLDMLLNVIKKANLELGISDVDHETVMEKIIEHSDGSPRQALVLLDQIRNLENAKEMLDGIEESHIKATGIHIARALMNSRITWKKMRPLLTEVTTNEVEGVRLVILGYANAAMLKTKTKSSLKRSLMIIDEFCDNFFDSKKAGLTRACFTIIAGSE
jgi:DNA polymerase III gamma/tau subunit